MRQVPNLLGVFRLVTTPLLAWLILLNTASGLFGAVVVLLLMAASDIADGKIARRYNIVSKLGIFLDTISDKIFVAGALIPMVEIDLLPSWVALLIITREFAVSGLRSYAAAEGVVIPARQWGKQKMAITVGAIMWCLLHAAALQLPGSPTWLTGLLGLWPVAIGAALVWTVGSGIEYFWNARDLLRRSL